LAQLTITTRGIAVETAFPSGENYPLFGAPSIEVRHFFRLMRTESSRNFKRCVFICRGQQLPDTAPTTRPLPLWALVCDLQSRTEASRVHGAIEAMFNSGQFSFASFLPTPDPIPVPVRPRAPPSPYQKSPKVLEPFTFDLRSNSLTLLEAAIN
jgi:hypothetical protein